MKNPDERFLHIHRFFDDSLDEKPSCYDLFMTDQGTLLGDNLFELDAFVLKGSLFSIPFGEFIERMKKMITSGELRAMIPDNQLDSEGDRILECLEMFLSMEDDDEKEESTIDQIFGKDEIPRLLASLTFSAYTYLEAYSKAIVEESAKNDAFASEMLLRIQRYWNTLPKRNRPRRIDSIPDLLDVGLERRLQWIEIGLGIEKTLETEFGANYGLFKGLFHYFVEMRHTLAHTDPAPPFEEYQHDFFESKLQDLREQFSILGEELRTQQLEKIVKPIENWIVEMSEPLTRIVAVGEMATIYPAMIDAVLVRHLARDSEAVE